MDVEVMVFSDLLISDHHWKEFFKTYVCVYMRLGLRIKCDEPLKETEI